MDAASFEEVWKVSKNGYNTAQDAHFVRLQTDFLLSNPRNNLVGFLRRERERRASHPSLKDASASVSIACAQASDGQVQLGAQDSVIKYLKYVKQNEVPTATRMVIYPDVAKLIQIAWEFGPNDNLGLEALKHIWRLYRTAYGKYRQIEFVGHIQIRYYWPKEVDPFSSRTNATNTWFSQWVVIKGTTPPSTDTVACLREFLARSTDPELFASDYIAQLGSSAQPLIFARSKDGRRQRCSVDHISVIIKRALASAKISTMKPRQTFAGSIDVKDRSLVPGGHVDRNGARPVDNGQDVPTALQRLSDLTHGGCTTESHHDAWPTIATLGLDSDTPLRCHSNRIRRATRILGRQVYSSLGPDCQVR
jgi:hypothetical protein